MVTSMHVLPRNPERLAVFYCSYIILIMNKQGQFIKHFSIEKKEAGDYPVVPPK